jgi:O-antigen ligase
MTFAALIVGYMVTHPWELGERLHAYTINPNGIGETAGYLTIICAYVALYDSSKSIKTAAYITGSVIATLIPFTGSRAGFGIALVGCGILAIPLIRRPLMFILIMLFISGTAFGIAQFVQPEHASRLADTSFESRMGVWDDAFSLIREKPIIGHGYIGNTEDRDVFSKNMHSAYLQITVETGVVGVSFLLIALAWTFIRSIGALRASRAAQYVPPIYLAFALLVSNVVSGFFDIGWVVGTTVNALMLAFAIGLIDRIPDMAAQVTNPSYEIDPELAAQQEMWPINSVA